MILSPRNLISSQISSPSDFFFFFFDYLELFCLKIKLLDFSFDTPLVISYSYFLNFVCMCFFIKSSKHEKNERKWRIMLLIYPKLMFWSHNLRFQNQKLLHQKIIIERNLKGKDIIILTQIMKLRWIRLRGQRGRENNLLFFKRLFTKKDNLSLLKGILKFYSTRKQDHF